MFETVVPIGDFELQTFDRMSIICTFCSTHKKYNSIGILLKGGEEMNLSCNVLFLGRGCSTQNTVKMKIKLRHLKRIVVFFVGFSTPLC